jgi:hypothetical protein
MGSKVRARATLRRSSGTYAAMPGLTALLLLGLQGGTAARPDPYRRVVERALARAEAGLLAAARFDVDHSRWEDPWVVVSEHYEVRSTRSYAQARAIADASEFLRGELVKLLGEGRGVRTARLGIWIFPNLSDYRRFGEANGAEHSSMYGSYYASGDAAQPVATYENGNPTQLGMWVTHSAVHQFLEQSFGAQRQVWIDEGLASYFALFWDWSWGASELARIQSARTFIPLKRLVQEPIQAYLAQPHERFIELGMLFHFLLNSCEATRNGAGGDPSTGPFQEFLRAAVRGQDVSDTEFVQTFEDAAELLEQDFREFDFTR